MSIDLSEKERRKWITIEQPFIKRKASSSQDQFRIEIRGEDVPKDRAGKFYLDDIEIRKRK